MPASPIPPSASSALVNPSPSSSTTAVADASLPHEQNADGLRGGVLGDVRERFLDHAVEGRLDLGRQPLLAETRFELHADPGRGAKCLDQAFDGRQETEVVECLRPQLDGKTPNILQRSDHELAERAERRRDVIRGLDRLQAEQHRRQRLPRLVVQLACQPAALELLALEHAPERIALHALRELDGDGGALREVLGQPQVGAREARIAAELVVRERDPDRRARRHEWNVEAGDCSEAPRDLLDDLGVVDDRVDALAAAASKHIARSSSRAR